MFSDVAKLVDMYQNSQCNVGNQKALSLSKCQYVGARITYGILRDRYQPYHRNFSRHIPRVSPKLVTYIPTLPPKIYLQMAYSPFCLQLQMHFLQVSHTQHVRQHTTSLFYFVLYVVFTDSFRKNTAKHYHRYFRKVVFEILADTSVLPPTLDSLRIASHETYFKHFCTAELNVSQFVP